MWQLGTVVFVAFVARASGAVCSMRNLPKFDGEYIHYVLSSDCSLTVTRNWHGSSLEGFKINSNKLVLCQSNGTGSPIHYVQIKHKPRAIYLVFIIYFRKELKLDMNSWRVVRINITSILRRKQIHRTILDSILTEYSTLYTRYDIRTCAYQTDETIYCFWQNGTQQRAQIYHMVGNDTISEYRAISDVYDLEGHANFGKVVGSLPGHVPRVLLFDNMTRDWLYEMPMQPNGSVPERRIQEMRHTGKIRGRIGNVAAMGIKSFVISDCNYSICEYRYCSLNLSNSNQYQIAQTVTICVFTSLSDTVSGVFEVPRNMLMPIHKKHKKDEERLPKQNVTPSILPQIEETGEYVAPGYKKWMDYTMIVIYAFTVASLLFTKLLIEIHIMILQPDDIPHFERGFTSFYACLFPGLSAECP